MSVYKHCGYIIRDFHQGSDRFSVLSRGRQCVPSCLVFVAKSSMKSVFNFTKNYLNLVLIEGDALYKHVKPTNTVQTDYFTLSDLPSSFPISPRTYDFNNRKNAAICSGNSLSISNPRKLYVGALQDQLLQIKKSSMKPCQDILNEYSRKVDFLKGLLQAEKMGTVSEKALAAEHLPNVSSSSVKGHNSALSAELQKKTVARHQKDIREELLGPDNEQSVDGSGLRQRNVKTDEDIDIVIQHQHQMHEKLAEEMLLLTRNLKQSIKDSGQIVKEDNKKLEESVKLTDGNFSKLKKESDRLEKHTQTCSWWIWIMLAIVTLTFLSMILFMKLFSKKV